MGGVFDKTILTKTGDYTKYSTVTSGDAVRHWGSRRIFVVREQWTGREDQIRLAKTKQPLW